MTKQKFYDIRIFTNDKTKYYTNENLLKHLKIISERLKYLGLKKDKYKIIIYNKDNEGFIAKDYYQPLPSIDDLNLVKSLWKEIFIEYKYHRQLTEF